MLGFIFIKKKFPVRVEKQGDAVHFNYARQAGKYFCMLMVTRLDELCTKNRYNRQEI